jgi:hypothetical protein
MSNDEKTAVPAEKFADISPAPEDAYEIGEMSKVDLNTADPALALVSGELIEYTEAEGRSVLSKIVSINSQFGINGDLSVVRIGTLCQYSCGYMQFSLQIKSHSTMRPSWESERTRILIQSLNNTAGSQVSFMLDIFCGSMNCLRIYRELQMLMYP